LLVNTTKPRIYFGEFIWGFFYLKPPPFSDEDRQFTKLTALFVGKAIADFSRF